MKVALLHSQWALQQDSNSSRKWFVFFEDFHNYAVCIFEKICNQDTLSTNPVFCELLSQ